MITRSTVLILGAGASQPYGFTSGGELRSAIIETLSTNTTPGFLALTQCGHKPDDLAEFRRLLLESTVPTIDEFLDAQPNFNDLGRRTICNEILSREQPNQLTSRHKGAWYSLFWDAIRTKERSVFRENKLSIITYNYDRSLENFLNVVSNAFWRNDHAEAGKTLKSLVIHHVYGCISPPPWEGQSIRGYLLKKPTAEELRLAADRIRVPAAPPPTGENSEIHSLVTRAERVYFLGFGYHDDNMAHLPLKHLEMLGKGSSQLPVQGTAHGMRPRDVARVNSKYPWLKLWGRRGVWGDAYEFLDTPVDLTAS